MSELRIPINVQEQEKDRGIAAASFSAIGLISLVCRLNKNKSKKHVWPCHFFLSFKGTMPRNK